MGVCGGGGEHNNETARTVMKGVPMMKKAPSLNEKKGKAAKRKKRATKRLSERKTAERELLGSHQLPPPLGGG